VREKWGLIRWRGKDFKGWLIEVRGEEIRRAYRVRGKELKDCEARS